jgi:hypothetical protein
MIAGTGITHSEFNHSRKMLVHFLQIWIFPETKGLEPGWLSYHPSGCCHTTIHQEIATGDKGAIRPHKKGCHICDLVRSSCPAGWTGIDHVPIPCASRPVQLIVGKRRHDNAGTDGVDSCSSLSPPYSFRHNA